MLQLVHVFEEENRSSWKHHLRAFFGHTPDDGDDYNPEDQTYIVCYCGGRLVRLGEDSNNQEVCAVWHNLVKIKGDDDGDE
jgi:hypothetical protein